ncbi:DMT family transporter [Carboxylicivirga sediminis]|uniref:DMT family transporter n=1 Tax=Carboxylicivirga sediminis TaxID=2006564 RepID=A0A941F0R5_9BACT|nr:DMT family transporter [Carboxylicivirga sediminis]MBR8534701.1 DMT family transporter [Carboxylicivirga sediminis]
MKGILLAATTALLWGILAIALKVALNYFDSYTIVWSRFFVATMVLIAYYTFKKPEMLKVYKRPPLMMIAGAVLLAGNYIGYMQGINYAGPAVTQIIIQTGPVMLGIIGFTVFKEKINLTRAIGFGIATVGFGLFYYHQLNEMISQKEALNKGVLWILGAASSWAGYAFFNKKLVQKHHPQQINLIIFGLPVLLFLPWVDFNLFVQSYEWWVWLLLIALGLNTVVAYGTLSAAFKYTEANKISIVIIMNPVITFIVLELMVWFDIRWFNIDKVSPLAYAGALLVIVGTILAIGLSAKKKH